MCTVLQLSGGKDSLACLYLLRPRWAGITVAWVNTGMAFPETLEQMQHIRALVPHFLEIHSTQNIRSHGYPADVVPLDVGFQSRYGCCAHALWQPMHEAMKAMGAKVVIRGQKCADHLKGPLKSGTVIEGIEYQFPLEDWTDAEVYAYLKEIGVKLPANYALMSTGLDCWNCTAYLDAERGRLKYLRQFHPDKYAIVAGKLAELVRAIDTQSEPLRRIL